MGWDGEGCSTVSLLAEYYFKQLLRISSFAATRRPRIVVGDHGSGSLGFYKVTFTTINAYRLQLGSYHDVIDLILIVIVIRGPIVLGLRRPLHN